MDWCGYGVVYSSREGDEKGVVGGLGLNEGGEKGSEMGSEMEGWRGLGCMEVGIVG